MKRFYKNVAVAQEADSWQVLLDGKKIRTPAGHHLATPSRKLADAIAQEWDAQTDTVRPDTMHLTQLQNTLQDRLAEGHAPWARELEDYLETDLLCYRADAPEEMIARQTAQWQVWLDWFAAKGLTPMPETHALDVVTIPEDVMFWLRQDIASCPGWKLMIWRHVAGLTGSCVLALALAEGAASAEQVFTCTTLEEQFYSELANESLHGQAPHVERAQASLKAELSGAADFAALLR